VPRARYKSFVDLASALGERLHDLRVSSSSADLAACARDLWPRALVGIQSGELPANRPAAVVWPERSEQISELIEVSRRRGYRVVPFGAGSGVCGGVLPDERTIVVDTKRLLDFRIDAHAPVVHAGAGVLGLTLEQALEKHGFTAGHFPSSIVCSTVGGWVAARGAGQCSSRYGKIEDMTAGLDCVLGTGDSVRFERRTAGPNLVPLMTGSEGTLGFITGVTLRLHPLPQSRTFLSFSCATIESGFDILRSMMQAGLRPAVARLYDPIDSILLGQSSDREKQPKKASARRSHWFSVAARQALSHPRWLQRTIEALEGNVLAGATLLLIFEGDTDSANFDSEQASRICARAGARSLGEGPSRRWLAHRYSVSYRQSSAFRLGAFTDTMEVAVPWSKLEAVYHGVRSALSRHALVMAHLSHAYPDGCSLYFTFSGLGASAGNAVARYDAAWRAGLAAALAAGANLSHHHGVGRSKAARLASEIGEGTELFNSVRHAWDPNGMFNPEALRAPLSVVAAPARGSREPFTLDRVSQLVEVDAQLSLGGLESLLDRHSLSLGLSENAPWTASLSDWISLGFPGARDAWADPVHSLVSGFEACASGVEARVRTAPRRATGPDLLALFAGTGNAVGRVERLTLAVSPRGVNPRPMAPFAWPRESAMNAGETHAFERICRSLSASNQSVSR